MESFISLYIIEKLKKISEGFVVQLRLISTLKTMFKQSSNISFHIG